MLKGFNHQSKDLSGRRFGRLAVIEIVGRGNRGRLIWKCRCDCGNVVEASSQNLLSLRKSSCGCLQRENRKAIGRRESPRLKHGMNASPEYRIWIAMRERCQPNHK